MFLILMIWPYYQNQTLGNPYSCLMYMCCVCTPWDKQFVTINSQVFEKLLETLVLKEIFCQVRNLNDNKLVHMKNCLLFLSCSL